MELHNTSIRNRRNEGVTLIELLISIGILMSVMFGITSFSIRSIEESWARQEYMTFLGLLERARNQSLHHDRGASHGVRVDQNQSVSFVGVDYTHRDSNYDSVTSSMSAFKKEGLQEIIFDLGSARVRQPGIISFISHNRRFDVEISSEGGIISRE